MTRLHRTPPRLVVMCCLAAAVGCGGGAGGGSMTGAAGSGSMAGTAGPTGAAGVTAAAGTNGAAGVTAAAGTNGAAGVTAAAGTNGAAGTKGAAGGPGAAGAGPVMSTACDAPNLVWKTGSKTNFTSYPAPGSDECIKYSGCLYEGQFAGCDQTEPLGWVMSHDIVAAFPDFKSLELHDLCLKAGAKTIVVTVLDTCGDSDCDGCCTKNKGTADELIDVESFTDMRWGVPDGRIQWADLGPTKTTGCK
jgi:hypothetical protein